MYFKQNINDALDNNSWKAFLEIQEIKMWSNTIIYYRLNSLLRGFSMSALLTFWVR